MKLSSLFIFLLTGTFLLVSCSKSPKNSTVITPVIIAPVIPQPLPNTIDKIDTIKVMAYNVLGYGNGCQGSTDMLNGYLKTIIRYVQPDLFSFEKMGDFPPASVSPANFADNITANVLNAISPGKYGFATPTNLTGADNMSVLFYNKQKLTFVKTETLLAYLTDFNLYKLYYNDPNLTITPIPLFCML